MYATDSLILLDSFIWTFYTQSYRIYEPQKTPNMELNKIFNS